MSSINFTSSHIRQVEIMKKQKSGNGYAPCSVNLVELSPTDKADSYAVKKVTGNWTCSLTTFINADIKDIKRGELNPAGIHIYALTEQNNEYEKLKPSKILGMIEVSEGFKDGNKIEILQTNPKYISGLGNRTPQYKHIGHGLIKSIKDIFAKTNLFVYPTKDAINFYKKEKFIPQNIFNVYNLMKFTGK